MAQKRSSDWRKQGQTAEMRKKLEPVNIILCAAGIFCTWATIFRSGAWMLPTLLVEAAGLAVYFAFPQYFTIIDSKEFPKTGSKAEVKHLELALVIPTVGLAYGSIRYEFLEWRVLLVIWLVFSGVLVGLYLRFSREVREEGHALATAAILSAFLACGLVTQGNHYLNFDPAEPELYTLVEKEISRTGRNRKNYEYVVETASGETMRITVGSRRYHQAEVGDQIPICIDTGAFGIEYAYFAAEE